MFAGDYRMNFDTYVGFFCPCKLDGKWQIVAAYGPLMRSLSERKWFQKPLNCQTGDF